MALNLSLVGACDAIRVAAADLLSRGEFSQPVGLTQGLLTQENRAGFQAIQDLGGQQGNYRQIDVYYQQRAIAAEVRSAKSCAAGTSAPRQKQNFVIDNYREVATTVSEDDIRVLCGNYSEFVSLGSSRSAGASQLRVMREIVEQLYLKEDALATVINQQVNIATIAGKGTYLGGATSNTYPVLKDLDYSLNMPGLVEMDISLDKLGWPGSPIVAGRGSLERAMKVGRYGCCNNAGQDFGRMMADPGFRYFVDEYTGTAVGNAANGFLAVMPGAAQFVTYNQYVGNYAGAMVGTDVVRGTLPSRYFPGVNYDFRIFSDGCAETYTVIMGLWFDVYTLPLTLFKVGDRMVGVNGVVSGIASSVPVA